MLKFFARLPENPFWVVAMRKRPVSWPHAALFALIGLVFPGELLINQYEDIHRMGTGLWITAICAILLYLTVAAASDSARSVVSERRKGTLVAIALSRLNSAEYADGIGLCTLVRLGRQLLWLLPSVIGFGLVAGIGPFSLVVTAGLVVLLPVIWAYEGIYISATSEDLGQAGKRAVVKPILTLIGSLFLFCIGGVIALPLWVFHPFFALGLATAGYDGPSGGGYECLFFWKGWAALCLPVYAFLILDGRRRAIKALERVRLF